jgi:hypothetical protein
MMHRKARGKAVSGDYQVVSRVRHSDRHTSDQISQCKRIADDR